jgi:hypothetical protein
LKITTPIDDLLLGLRQVADTMPPAPSHALWLNWYPPEKRQNMVFSLEANRYFAVYGEWEKAADDGKYVNWTMDRMREMERHSMSIQLADENLGRRPAQFLGNAQHRILIRGYKNLYTNGRVNKYMKIWDIIYWVGMAWLLQMTALLSYDTK